MGPKQRALKSQARNSRRDSWGYGQDLVQCRDHCLLGSRLLRCEEILSGMLDRWRGMREADKALEARPRRTSKQRGTNSTTTTYDLGMRHVRLQYDEVATKVIVRSTSTLGV